MKLKPRFYILLALIILASAFLIYSNRHRFLINKGIYYYNRGEYKKAAEHLSPLMKIRKNDSDVAFTLSRAYSAQNDFDSALQTLKDFIEANPESKNAKYLLGKFYFERGNIGSAARSFLDYIGESKPDWDNFEDFFALSVISYREGKYLPFLANYEKFQKNIRKDDLTNLHVLRTLCYDKAGLWDAAAAGYSELRAGGVKNPIIIFREGVIFLGRGASDKAEYNFDIAAYFGYPSADELKTRALEDACNVAKAGSISEFLGGEKITKQQLYLWFTSYLSLTEKPRRDDSASTKTAGQFSADFSDQAIKILGELETEDDYADYISEINIMLGRINMRKKPADKGKLQSFFKTAFYSHEEMRSALYLSLAGNNEALDLFMKNKYSKKISPGDKDVLSGAAVKNGEALLFKNGSVDMKFKIDKSGFYQICILHRAESSGGIYPCGEIEINGVFLSDFYARTKEYKIAKYRAFFPEGVNALTIKYQNDVEYLKSSQDRNLFIGSVFLINDDAYPAGD